MEPINGLILILIWGGLNALIAVKRGRSGWAFFGLSVLPVVPVAIFMAKASGGDSTITGWSVFACPLVACIVAVTIKSGKEAAVSSGAYGEYVRCPYCAEPVRRLATKCRHCQSDLPASDGE
jgi:hypothetical protein